MYRTTTCSQFNLSTASPSILVHPCQICGPHADHVNTGAHVHGWQGCGEKGDGAEGCGTGRDEDTDVGQQRGGTEKRVRLGWVGCGAEHGGWGGEREVGRRWLGGDLSTGRRMQVHHVTWYKWNSRIPLRIWCRFEYDKVFFR